jgi:hypothetical protein
LKNNHSNFTLSHKQAIIKKRNNNFTGKTAFSIEKRTDDEEFIDAESRGYASSVQYE